jgi:hypothetical protein
MTERLVIRVALHDQAAEGYAKIPGEAADDNRGSLSKRARAWRIGSAVAVGVSIVVAAALIVDFPGGGPTSNGDPVSEARTNGRAPVETGGNGSTDNTAIPLEPAARPVVERQSVSPKVTVPPTTVRPTAVRPTTAPPAATDAGVGAELGAKRPFRPSAVDKKPVAKPRTPVPRDGAMPGRQATAYDVAGKSATESADMAASETPKETGARPAAAVITDPHVVRAELSAGIRAKEPTARLQSPIQATGRESRTIYFFSEVRDLGGKTLLHRWERDGKVIASVPFEVRGERWRFYSKKTITPRMTGGWRVVLVDSAGKELASTAFEVR